MLPPQSLSNISRLAKQDIREHLKKQNGQKRGSSQPSIGLGSFSFFQSEYDIQTKSKNPSKKHSKVLIKTIDEIKSTDTSAFGKSVSFRENQKSRQNKGTFDYKKFNQVFQDDLTYLIRYAITSNADKYSLSPHRIAQMREAEIKKSRPKSNEQQNQQQSQMDPQKSKAKKQQDFLERNYGKQFKEQQKIFDDHRKYKLKAKEDAENNYEKIDPPVWKTSLAIMKYQVQKDQYQIENNQRKNKNEYDLMNHRNALQQHEFQKQQKEEQKLKDRSRKGAIARTVSVKINANEQEIMESYKKPIIKNDDQIERDVRRLIAIDQRQQEKTDAKVNNYFMRIQRQLQTLYKLKPGLEKENYRNVVMKEIRDNEQIMNDINDQIISKYEEFLVETIIDEILIENVYLLDTIEKKQKLTKKQMRNAAITEFKNCFVEYFDDAQEAILNLVYVGQPKPEKVIRYDHVLIETGYGLLLSSLDSRKKYDIHRRYKDYSDKNNVSLLNLIARDIAYELVDEVAESFDKISNEFTNQLFNSEFE